MRKRVLFCIENFQHGGISKALENILQLYDREKLDVGLFVVNQEDGPYKEVFAPFVKYKSDSLLTAYCTHLSTHSGIGKYALMLIKAYRKMSMKLKRDPLKQRLQSWANKIERDSYDCVIAFAEGYITEFVSHIKGHKSAWIHIDYKRHLHYANNIDERTIYQNFDNIMIPSQYSAKSFEEVFPSLKDKIRVIPNVINTQLCKEKSLIFSNLDNRFNTSHFTIISVGRVCYEKRFFEIPRIAKSLMEKSVDFRWYIVGDGSKIETTTLYNAIVDAGVEEYVIPLGRKDNPYPYIAQSDLLASTSLSETFSYVIFEAKSLGVPVICTDFGTAPEIINDEEGIISPMDKMDSEIANLIFDKSHKYNKLKHALRFYHYDNNKILNQIYQLF